MEKRYVISVSLGNYLHGTGGTGKVVLEHQQLYQNHNVSYFHISPFEKKVYGKKLICNLYNVLLDGVDLGIFSEKQIMNKLFQMQENGWFLDSIVLHHLIRCNLKFISALCRSSDCPIIFYVHDYYSICPNHTLLKNQKVFCGEAPPSEQKCVDCLFFSQQKENFAKISALLESISERVVPVAPSPCALNIWEHTYPKFFGKGRVIYHQKAIRMIYRRCKNNNRLRIGYIGAQISYKGWEQWCFFVNYCVEHELPYDLYYFGNYPNHIKHVQYVKVNVSKENPTAMVDALRDYNIDAAFLFSIWPETYSYTYFESWSAGCAVITQKDSGNIADMTRKNKNGLVYDSVDDLIKDASLPAHFYSTIRQYKEVRSPDKLEVNQTGILSLLSNKNHKIKADVSYPFHKSALGILIDIFYCTKYRLPIGRK